MSSFTFNPNIPAAANNPSNDQPDMLQNNMSTNSLLAVDHVSFNTNNGGQHLQVTLPATTYVVPGAQTGNASVIYPNEGETVTAAQLYYVNSQATIQLSAIRAWAFCDSAGAIQNNQAVNIASIVHAGTGIFNVTLTTNAVSSAQFAIIVSSAQYAFNATTRPPVSTSTITGTGTFTLNFFTLNLSPVQPVDPLFFSFLVLQI